MSCGFWPMLLVLAAISAHALYAGARGEPFERIPRAPFSGIEKLLVGTIALLGVIFALRVTLAPECGFDSIFRWDFLAERMLYLKNFKFYPPMTAGDFRMYPYADGIPPLVSFANFWMYTAAGRYAPAATALFVVPQWLGAIYFTAYIGKKLHSRGAGLFAAAVLATCPLFNASVAIGQETGMTALGTAAMLCFILGDGGLRAESPAGIAAGAICLSREYGAALALCGLITAMMLRRNIRWMAVYAIVVFVVASPWYFRNWQITGNPLYDNAFFGFPVNPLHQAIMYRNTGRRMVRAHGARPSGKRSWTKRRGERRLYFSSASPVRFICAVTRGWRLRRWLRRDCGSGRSDTPAAVCLFDAYATHAGVGDPLDPCGTFAGRLCRAAHADSLVHYPQRDRISCDDDGG